MSDRFRSDRHRDLLRLELQILKLVGQFHDLVSRKLCQIVDEYHCGRGLGNEFEEGPLKLMLIADYANVEEEIIAAAYAWLRQEINASRWIASKKSGFLQPLMTVLEYKGFRALAMLNLPLGANQTMVANAEAGVIEESILQKLKNLSIELNLVASYPYRLPDGRIVQVSLSPNLEVHKLEGIRASKRETRGKMASARTPPGLYITNVHDIMPAYPVTEDLRGLLYFRSEFIESLSAPVAPGDVQSETRHSVLRILRDSRLPLVLNKLEALDEVPLDSEEWRLILHQNGLNMALLGAVAQDTRLPHVREGALIEMIARTAKVMLRSRIRGAILHFREVQALRVEEELATIVLETLNGILMSDQVWMDELRTAIDDRFGYQTDTDTIKHLGRNALLLALQHHCCVRLKEAVYAKNGLLGASDFLGFGVQFAGGGNGPFSLTKVGDSISEFANIILSSGQSLWLMEGRRALAAKMAMKIAEEKIDEQRWEDAMKYAELAAGLCPRQHPNQILIRLLMTTIKSRGPANLAWRSPVLGEKPTASAINREEIVVEELKKTKTALVHTIDKHFGHHHPLGIKIRIQIAELMETVHMGKEHGLQLRSEALTIAHKILGRNHLHSRKLLSSFADSLLANLRYDEAISAYSEAIKLATVDDGSGLEKAHLQFGLVTCWKCKGNYEAALDWACQCRDLLESIEIGLNTKIFEDILEEIAELSTKLYAADIRVSTTGESPLKTLLSEEILAETIAKQLETAIDCYIRLFDARRNRHDLNTIDGEALLILVRKIVLLSLRLATPTQRPVIRAAARRKLFQRDELNRENIVRELLVRMVAGPATPQEIVERVLTKAQNVETLPEAEAELAILLDLIIIQ